MKKYSVKVLDCTLRDGGYLIDWNFGKNTVQSILAGLEDANVDYIECGFLKSCDLNSDKTFFPSVESLIPFCNPKQEYTLMINFGEYDISNFSICKTPNIKIRVAFKKHNQKEALNYIQELIKLGWGVFVNPMITNAYSESELLLLVSEINKIKPFGISIVDTLGNMYETQVVEIFRVIDENLDSDIALGFHSHNSLQLSFSNTKTLLNMGISRNIVIDSCVYGMGRGAGNLCTELITKYLNDKYEKRYNLSAIIKIINDELMPIYHANPWGYSPPYYVAATYGCHPNYVGQFLKNGVAEKEIEKFLQLIPVEKRAIYEKNVIENLLILSKTC